MRNLSIIYLICVLIFIIAPIAGGNNSIRIEDEYYYSVKKEIEEKKEAEYMFLNWNIPITVVDINIEFYKQNIPPQYSEAFLKATENHKDLRMILFAMMRLETQEFTHYVSRRTNDNGTMDYGPLMLNSANLKSEDFRKKYFPSSDFFDEFDFSNLTEEEIRYNIYMVACVNLFIAHMKTYSNHVRWEQIMKSVKAYNAGPKVLRQTQGKAVRRANSYYQNVVKNIESSKIAFNNMCETYKNELDSRVFEVVW